MTPIKPASTILLIRKDNSQEPRILMGQRGAKAVFMPSKFVFPGGALDTGDDHPLPLPLDADSAAKLTGVVPSPAAFVGAALRELREETGLLLDSSLAKMRFIFRAITPPKRPRRFDACFFLADAAAIIGDPDDFSKAEDELSHLQWLPLSQARELDLPFITEVVLAEASHLIKGGAQEGVPFFDNSTGTPAFRRL